MLGYSAQWNGPKSALQSESVSYVNGGVVTVTRPGKGTALTCAMSKLSQKFHKGQMVGYRHGTDRHTSKSCDGWMGTYICKGEKSESILTVGNI